MTRLYGGNMGRARYSQGYVLLTKTDQWQANWFPYVIDPSTGKEKRVHKTQIVGQPPKMRRYEAEKALRAIVEPIQATNGGEITFGWFLTNRWLPMKEGCWRPSSKQAYAALIEALEARFGSRPLQSMDKVEIQAWINEMGKIRSGSTVKRLRVMLKSILAEAVDQDYLAKDPSRKLTVPKGMMKPDTTVLSWEQLKSILACLNQRDRLILMIEAMVGLRPSELFALRRKSFTGTQLVINETIYRGKLRDYGKTDGSLTTVDLPDSLAAQLRDWLTSSAGSDLTGSSESSNGIGDRHHGRMARSGRDYSDAGSADSFIFSNSTGGFIQKDNYLMRVIYPIRKSLGLKKLNFQVLRRTFATLAQKHGSVKDIQRQMRHTTPDLTVNTYMQPLAESVRSMVEAMYEEMVGTKVIQ